MVPNLTGVVLEGKYKLTQPLGEGGMGFVYAGEHATLGRPIAVKFLRPELASDPNALARLRQEAVAASSIGSPHIVEVLDLGTAPGGAPYIVMEFLRGRSLAALLAESPMLPTPRIANIVCQTLLALQGAHARGIVHRDLKPENIFLADTGEGDFVKLLDFGVSKVRGELSSSNLTQTGAVLGTPRFMAPEQAAGLRNVDHRVDIWATGVVLYRALTGRYPYDADNYNALLAQILMASPPAPRLLRPDLDPTLELAILTALARDPAARFPSADAFRQVLAPYASGGSGSTVQPAGAVPAPYPPAGPSGGWTPMPPGTPPGWTPMPSGAPAGWTPMPTGPSAGGGPYPGPAGAAYGMPGQVATGAGTPMVPGTWASVPGVAPAASVAVSRSGGRRTLGFVLGIGAAAAIGVTVWFIAAPPWADGSGGRPAATTATTTAADRNPAGGPAVPATEATGLPPTAPSIPSPGSIRVDSPGTPVAPQVPPPPATEATPDAGAEPPTTPFGQVITDPAVLQALARMQAASDAGSSADVTPEQARERDLYVAITVEITCANQSFAMAAFENAGPNFDPMAFAAAQEKLTEEVVRRHGLTVEQYGEISGRWSGDSDAMSAMTAGMMKCVMGMMGEEEAE
ncbi:MAG: protein kinase [Deltaproteobacteria bacterium]|nr:protein kinase [Deltaproteobacteria bacterium]